MEAFRPVRFVRLKELSLFLNEQKPLESCPIYCVVRNNISRTENIFSVKEGRFLLKRWIKYGHGIGFIVEFDHYGCFDFEYSAVKTNKFSTTVCEFLLENVI